MVVSTAGQSRRYVRCAETHPLKSGDFQLIVCMSANMSLRLMHAKRLSIDMSFKRVNGKWEEFEIETWNDEHMRCMSFFAPETVRDLVTSFYSHRCCPCIHYMWFWRSTCHIVFSHLQDCTARYRASCLIPLHGWKWYPVHCSWWSQGTSTWYG